jgi:hypothetical protein
MRPLARVLTAAIVVAVALTTSLAPAQAETGSEPSLDLSYSTTSDGYLVQSVSVFATDPDGLADAQCSIDGARIWTPHVQPGDLFAYFSVSFPVDGLHTLACSASDVLGNTTSKSVTVLVDVTKPTVSQPTVTPMLKRTDETAQVSIFAADDASGLQEVLIRMDYFGSGNTWVPMSPGAGAEFTFDIGTDLPAGQYGFSFVAVDRAGNSTDAQIVLGGLQVYDTRLAASASGTFQPPPYGGSRLPGLTPFAGQDVDFRLSVSYRNDASTHPDGRFSMTFQAGHFRARATSFSVLVPHHSRVWWVRGTATVTGDETPYTFLIELVDGEWPDGVGNDFISIALYPPGAPSESSENATYFAYGPLTSGEIVFTG